MTTVERVGAYVSFALSAPFILLTAATFAVVGPVLWVPLVVRSLLTYAVLLLLHAIAGREMQGSTSALEASIAWYFASFPRILSHLSDPFQNPTSVNSSSTEQEAVSTDADRHNPLSFEFWRGLILGAVDFVKQTIWAAVFWTGAIVGFAHYGYGPAEALVQRFLSLPAVHRFLVQQQIQQPSQSGLATVQKPEPALAQPKPRPRHRHKQRQ